jgi:hypothetical protein
MINGTKILFRDSSSDPPRAQILDVFLTKSEETCNDIDDCLNGLNAFCTNPKLQLPQASPPIDPFTRKQYIMFIIDNIMRLDANLTKYVPSSLPILLHVNLRVCVLVPPVLVLVPGPVCNAYLYFRCIRAPSRSDHSRF